jgi:hypothetical protein
MSQYNILVLKFINGKVCFMKLRLGCLLVLVAALLAGCGSGSLDDLKNRNIQKVAIISVRSDTRMHSVTRGGGSGLINMLQDVGKGGLEGDVSKKLTENEEFFLFQLMGDLQEPLEKWVKSLDIEIYSSEKLAKNSAYKSVPITTTEAGIYYSIPPYRNIDQPKAEVLKDLCEKLGVDALVTFRTYFEREAYRDAFQLPFTPDYLKFFAKVDIMVFDNEGQTVYQQRFEGVSPEIIGYDKSQYQFSFDNPEMTRVIKKTVGILKTNVKEAVSQAQTQ